MTEIISSIAQLGAGGVLAILIVKMVLDHLKSRNKDQASGHCDLFLEGWPELLRQVRDLHEWHAKEDGDGIKVWYRSRQADRALERISEALERQTLLLEKMDGRLAELRGAG